MYKNLPNHTRASVNFCNAKEFDLHIKNKEEKLTKTWDQTVPIPGNGAKFDRGKTAHEKCMFWNQELKVHTLAFSILSL